MKNPTSTGIPPVNTQMHKSHAVIEWLQWYAENQYRPLLHDQRRCFSPDVILEAGMHGLLGLNVPEQHGGLGLSISSTMRVCQQLGSIDLSLATLLGNHNFLGILPVMKYGSTQLREEYLSPLAQGRQLVSFALSEPGAGSNPMSIRGKATIVDDGYLVNANKMWIGSAGWASLIITFVKLADTHSPDRGITCFAVPRNKPGVRIGKELLTMGMRGMVQNRISLDVVKLEQQYLVGSEEKGMEIANEAMMLARMTAGATLLGAMKKCIQLMYRYTSRREVSTGLLLKNAITRQQLGSSIMEATLLESLVNYIASAADRDIHRIPAELCIISKVAGSEFVWKAVDTAMQCTGGRGYLENNYLPQLMRDARVIRIFEGPSEVLVSYMGSKHIRAVDKDQLYDLVGTQLRQPQLAAELENVYQRSRELLKGNFQDINLIAFHNGNMLTWVLLLAVYAGTASSPDPAVISYARQKIHLLTTQLNDFKSVFRDYNIDSISTYAEKINYDIGNLDMLSPDEEYDVDDYFRK